MKTIRHHFATRSPYNSLSKSLALLALVGLLASCAKSGDFEASQAGLSNGSSQGSSSVGAGSGSVPAFKAEPLAWESASRPERKAWSTATMNIVSGYFAILDKASDTTTFCPTYKTLTKNEKINVWANIFAGMAYYESSWNPASNSVDVGTAGNKDTYSVGLLQMSVVDQANYKLSMGFDFADLQNPINNLELGIAIMAKQITKYGKILIPVGGSGLYWATIHPGGKYDHTAGIATMVKKLSFCH